MIHDIMNTHVYDLSLYWSNCTFDQHCVVCTCIYDDQHVHNMIDHDILNMYMIYLYMYMYMYMYICVCS